MSLDTLYKIIQKMAWGYFRSFFILKLKKKCVFILFPFIKGQFKPIQLLQSFSFFNFPLKYHKSNFSIRNILIVVWISNECHKFENNFEIFCVTYFHLCSSVTYLNIFNQKLFWYCFDCFKNTCLLCNQSD